MILKMMRNETMTIAKRLRELLEEEASKINVDAVLLSGGLDSSITTYLLRHSDPTAITVILLENPGKDEEYSIKVSKKLSVKHIILKVNVKYAISKIPDIVKILKTFSPMEIPNDIPILIALEYAKSQGFTTLATGDGGDELFCGYSYMTKMSYEELEKYIQNLPKFWYFPTFKLSERFNINSLSIFLKDRVINYALSIPVKYKLYRDDNTIITKYILRLAFQDVLPRDVVWRIKEPIEYGSGFTYIRKVIENMISDYEFHREVNRIIKEDNVKIVSKEQLYYYKIYREFYEPPHQYSKTSLRCPYCGADLNPHNLRYCYVCGSCIDV